MEKITAFLDELCASGKVPGCECIVYKDHQEVYRHRTGWSDYKKTKPVSSDDLYMCYSITKVLTCTAAMQLVEQGKLLPEAPVSDYLPEFAALTILGDGEAVPAKQSMRVWHLFSMTAGLDYDMGTVMEMARKERDVSNLTTREAAAYMAKKPLSFEPGERYQYSLCHDVLGAIIEEISGLTLDEYIRKNIAEPLGMVNTTMDPTEAQKARLAAMYDLDEASGKLLPVPCSPFCESPKYFSGGAGLYSNPGDLILLADALACGGVGANGVRILKEETVARMSRNLLDKMQLNAFRREKTSTGRFEPYGYGYGVRTRMIPSQAGCPVGEFGWSGAAGAYMLIDPINHLCFFYTQHVRKTRASWEIAPVIQETVYSELIK